MTTKVREQDDYNISLQWQRKNTQQDDNQSTNEFCMFIAQFQYNK